MSLDLPPVAGDSGQQHFALPSNVYVVMGEFTYPSGLYGAHSVIFLEPGGVPRPKGDPGHSSVYLLH